MLIRRQLELIRRRALSSGLAPENNGVGEARVGHCVVYAYWHASFLCKCLHLIRLITHRAECEHPSFPTCSDEGGIDGCVSARLLARPAVCCCKMTVWTKENKKKELTNACWILSIKQTRVFKTTRTCKIIAAAVLNERMVYLNFVVLISCFVWVFPRFEENNSHVIYGLE